MRGIRNLMARAYNGHSRVRKRNCLFFLWVFPLVITCLFFCESHADPHSLHLHDKGDEMLLFQDIPSVFGASKYEQKLSEAPSSVSIVTSREIKKYGYRTLGDILKNQSGFFITYDRVYHYVGARGFSRPGDLNTRILLLVDGHRINDAIFDQALLGTEFPVDIDLVDRVEIIRGPSSSIYGSNAFFGVINVITKRGRVLRGTEVSGEAASHDTYKGRITYGNRFHNGWEVLVSGTGFSSDGRDLYFREFDRPGVGDGVARGLDGDDFYSLFTNISYKDFALQSAFHSREKGIPTAPAGRIFNDPDSWADDVRAYLNLKYDRVFDNGWSLLARLYYDYYKYEGFYPYLLSLSEKDPLQRVVLRDLARAQWFGGEAQVSRRFFDSHRVILGAEFRSNFAQDQSARIRDRGDTLFESKKDSHSWALYVQDEFQILDNLILNAGLRFDHHDLFGGRVNPRIALIYNPVPKTTLKFLYGRAFRSPNAYELYYLDSPHGDLGPETIDTYEFVWEQSLREAFRLRTSLFHYNIRDIITLQEDLLFRNVDKANATGVEVELEGKLPHGLEGYLSYTLQVAEDGRTGERLTNSPRHMVKAGLSAPLYEKSLFGSLNLRYMDSRLTLQGGDADDYFVVDGTLFSRNLFSERLELSTSIYNIFDKNYGYPASQEHHQDIIRQDGRTWRLKATYSF